MPSLSESKTHNASFAIPKSPVAIFVGGTAGIGEGMARAFAQYTNGNAHIIIVGRNQSAAESLISSFPPPHEGEGKYEFIKCDITLMVNIYNTCYEIRKRVAKINYLVLSAGLASFAAREDTKEGLERKLVIRYYSRWAFIDGLLPNLLELAKREPGIAFTHMYPGFVRHSRPGIEGLGKALYYIMLPILWLTGKLTYVGDSAEEGGMYRRDPKGEDIGMTKFPGTEEDQGKLWEHSAEEISKARVASQ
ncbi:hypothetical protein BDQ17DRAFT_1354932 [Cyathus striatus]|nr:hypothetical protein BDQ17DRAFT_1354932 [Cyathus striatus]